MLKPFRTLISIFKFYKLKGFIILFRQLHFWCLQTLSNGEVLRNIYDYKMYLPLDDDGLARVLFVIGSRELEHKWMVDNEVRSDDTILDLGANIGYYILMESKKLNESSKIYAVEPDPRNIKILSKNLKLNNLSERVDFKQCAISSKNGSAKFGLHRKTNLNSFNLVSKTSFDDVEEVDVELIDFAEYVQKINGVDFVRMDIEGHEYEILISLCRLLNSNSSLAPRTIIFETHKYDDIELMKQTLKELFEKGYKPKYISSDDERNPDGSVFQKYGYKPFMVIDEWEASRGIYENISSEDAIDLISNWEGTRTVCLEKL